MNKSAIRLLTLAMYAMALIAVPLTTAYAAGGDSPSPPASDTKDTKKVKKKKDKSSSIDDPKFLEGYRAAYATIYDRNDYSSAIEQLKALGQDDRADVANLIGYSYRKLGDYKVSQIWYERALQADPDHVRTWQYYGLWQVEQGNRDSASAGAALQVAPAFYCQALCFVSAASLHQRLGFGPESLTRGVARIEHVPARIDHELDAVGRSVGRQLIEQDLRTEIRRGEIEQPVRHQQLQFRIKRQNLPQLGNRLGGIKTAAEIPGFADAAIQ